MVIYGLNMDKYSVNTITDKSNSTKYGAQMSKMQYKSRKLKVRKKNGKVHC